MIKLFSRHAEQHGRHRSFTETCEQFSFMSVEIEPRLTELIPFIENSVDIYMALQY